MNRSDFLYELPPELVAQYPLLERGASRLLCVNGATGELIDRQFHDLLSLAQPGDLLIFNDTRVIRARVFGVKPTGGKVEVLVERVLGPQRVLAQVRASKAPVAGSELQLGVEHKTKAAVRGRVGEFFDLEFPEIVDVLAWLEHEGRLPLPPYIERLPDRADEERYQTVYARVPGAVAAPTAGLHFSREFLAQLQSKGVDIGYVTLHVGAGTFQPVRVDRLADHQMHSEYAVLTENTCAQIRATQQRGGRIIAVGTTAVRVLETAAQQSGGLAPFAAETRLFITPGFRFRVVNAIITNFHLPESTLLMLVCAFGGYDNVMAAYRHAVAARYRFFSYGDAMWLTPTPVARPNS